MNTTLFDNSDAGKAQSASLVLDSSDDSSATLSWGALCDSGIYDPNLVYAPQYHVQITNNSSWQTMTLYTTILPGKTVDRGCQSADQDQFYQYYTYDGGVLKTCKLTLPSFCTHVDGNSVITYGHYVCDGPSQMTVSCLPGYH